MRKILALILTALFAFAFAAPANARPASGATLAVSSDAPVVGDSLVFSGCGYGPGVGVTVTVQSPTALAFFGSIADADGCFSTGATENFVVTVVGDYTASTWQGGRKALASAAFTVN